MGENQTEFCTVMAAIWWVVITSLHKKNSLVFVVTRKKNRIAFSCMLWSAWVNRKENFWKNVRKNGLEMFQKFLQKKYSRTSLISFVRFFGSTLTVSKTNWTTTFR